MRGRQRTEQQQLPPPEHDESDGLTLAEVLRALKGEGVTYYGLGEKHIADDYEKERARGIAKRRAKRKRPAPR